MRASTWQRRGRNDDGEEMDAVEAWIVPDVGGVGEDGGELAVGGIARRVRIGERALRVRDTG